MINESSQPRPDDAVLGGQNPPPIYAAVLGGIQGIKHQLSTGTLAQQIAALSKALSYEGIGQEVLVQALSHSSETVQWAAYSLLWDRGTQIQWSGMESIYQALKEYSQHQGLQAYYRFEDENCIGKDYSGQGNDGKTYGKVSLVNGIVGKAMQLRELESTSIDPPYCYLLIPNTLSQQEYSISLWVYLGIQYHHSLFMLPSGGHWNSSRFWLFTHDGKLAVLQSGMDCRYYNTRSYEFQQSQPLEERRFYLVTVTYKHGSLKIYLNQDEYATYVNVPPISASTALINVGLSPNGTGRYQVKGKIDELRIYNQALTQTSISALYALGMTD
jgi:hypothetical protein